jgi:sugar phosphate isomerase/epimerase
MAIKLAFSTVACPEWTIEQACEQARQMGYDGIELRTLDQGGVSLACDPALSEPAKVNGIFRAHGIEPICLSTSASLHYKDASAAHQSVWTVQRYIEQAAEIGCKYVRVFGSQIEPGQNTNSTLQRIAQRAVPLADRAGELGVTLLFENAASFSIAKHWWWMFNLIEHPMVAMCWNVANAAAAGEGPAVSVPMLNSRIAMAKVKDLIVGEGSGFVPLGEGTVQVEHFIKRLMGIGFDGYLTVEWDRAWLPSLTPAEQYLPDAHARLKGWLDAIAQQTAAAQGKGAKAAAKK